MPLQSELTVRGGPPPPPLGPLHLRSPRWSDETAVSLALPARHLGGQPRASSPRPRRTSRRASAAPPSDPLAGAPGPSRGVRAPAVADPDRVERCSRSALGRGAYSVLEAFLSPSWSLALSVVGLLLPSVASFVFGPAVTRICLWFCLCAIPLRSRFAGTLNIYFYRYSSSSEVLSFCNTSSSGMGCKYFVSTRLYLQR